MNRLISLLLLPATLALGLSLAGQEAADPIDAANIETEAEVEAAFDALAAQGQDQAEWPNSASQFLASHGDLSIFLMLLEQADMTETLLEGDRPITIFAPNDAAFARMDPLRFSTLVDDPAGLRNFLERHIVTDRYSLTDISAGLASTVPGGEPGAKAATAGVEGDAAGAGAGDGVIDIDAASVPSAQDATESVAGGGPASDSVASAIVTTPDPRSFVRLNTRSGADLEVGTRPARVRRELLQHDDSVSAGTAAVASGRVASDPAPEAFSATSYYVGDARIVSADLGVEDATVHVIDSVLLPAQSQGAAGQ